MITCNGYHQSDISQHNNVSDYIENRLFTTSFECSVEFKSTGYIREAPSSSDKR